MKYLFLLTLLFFINLSLGQDQCSTCDVPNNTQVLNIDNKGAYTINSNDIIQINNMNGSGTITNYGILYLPNGLLDRQIINYGTIIIGNNATIKKDLTNYGTTCILSNTQVNNGSTIFNSGKFTINGNLHFNSNGKVYNIYDGCMNINGNTSMDNRSEHCNSGNIVISGNINVTNGGTFSACTGFVPGESIINQNNNGTYIISNNCNCIFPLNIEIELFEIIQTINYNTINIIIDENINKYYTLYKSIDGINFKSLKSFNNNLSLNDIDINYKTIYYKLNTDIKVINRPIDIDLQYFNYLGQEIKDIENYTGLLFILYKNGKIIKTVK